MTTAMKRPKTSHSHRRSGCRDPKLAWEAEDSLQVTKITPKERKNKLHVKMESTMYEQPIRDAGGVSKSNGLDFTTLSNGNYKEANSNVNGLKDPDYFYLTSHRKDFIEHQIAPTQNARPKSSKLYPSSSKVNKSSYQEDFRGTDAAVGEQKNIDDPKRNNPHPLHGFTVWRFPRHLPPPEPMQDLDMEAIERVSKRLLKSTYKTDYLGTPQGVRMDEPKLNIPLLNSVKPPYTLDSTKRIDYQQPQVRVDLKNNTTKYGCNSLKHIPATGAVPNVFLKSSNMQKGATTTYSDEFIDKSENKTRTAPFEG